MGIFIFVFVYTKLSLSASQSQSLAPNTAPLDLTLGNGHILLLLLGPVNGVLYSTVNVLLNYNKIPMFYG